MLTRIHRKLGTAGFVISIVALVAALGGGAYAASGGLTGKQKKEVEKIAKKYAKNQGQRAPRARTAPLAPLEPRARRATPELLEAADPPARTVSARRAPISAVPKLRVPKVASNTKVPPPTLSATAKRVRKALPGPRAEPCLPGKPRLAPGLSA